MQNEIQKMSLQFYFAVVFTVDFFSPLKVSEFDKNLFFFQRKEAHI